MKGNEEKEPKSYIQIPTKSLVLFMAGAFIAGRISKRRPVYNTEGGGHTYSIGSNEVTIWCQFRSDANKIHDKIEELYYDYGCITLSDLSEILDLSGYPSYTKIGWDDISGFEVRPKFGGYAVTVPKWKNLDSEGEEIEDGPEHRADEE